VDRNGAGRRQGAQPTAVEGQIEGGTAQGLGLALMEEIQTRDGVITNASFTDYLIPTFLDMPPSSPSSSRIPSRTRRTA
jgi:CO/xanthine dehydrogenase Mo-binding subunit